MPGPAATAKVQMNEEENKRGGKRTGPHGAPGPRRHVLPHCDPPPSAGSMVYGLESKVYLIALLDEGQHEHMPLVAHIERNSGLAEHSRRCIDLLESSPETRGDDVQSVGVDGICIATASGQQNGVKGSEGE